MARTRSRAGGVLRVGVCHAEPPFSLDADPGGLDGHIDAATPIGLDQFLNFLLRLTRSGWNSGASRQRVDSETPDTFFAAPTAGWLRLLRLRWLSGRWRLFGGGAGEGAVFGAGLAGAKGWLGLADDEGARCGRGCSCVCRRRIGAHAANNRRQISAQRIVFHEEEPRVLWKIMRQATTTRVEKEVEWGAEQIFATLDPWRQS